jgi:hypothetical protein
MDIIPLMPANTPPSVLVLYVSSKIIHTSPRSLLRYAKEDIYKANILYKHKTLWLFNFKTVPTSDRFKYFLVDNIVAGDGILI